MCMSRTKRNMLERIRDGLRMEFYRNRRVCRKCGKVFYCSYCQYKAQFCGISRKLVINECVGPCCHSALWKYCLGGIDSLSKGEAKKFFKFLKKENLLWEFFYKGGKKRL